MQSRGLFTARRSTDDAVRRDAGVTHRSNGDVVRNEYRFSDRLTERAGVRAEDHRQCCSQQAAQNRGDRSVYPRSSAYAEDRATDGGYMARGTELQPRRARQRDYTALYENGVSWAGGLSDLNGSKPILRNGIAYGRGERLYSSTLPRRGRTINFNDQPASSLECRRGYYPRSLQDLSDLESDDRMRYPGMGSLLLQSGREWRNDRSLEDARRRRRCREERLRNDYLRLYRSLSRLNTYPQGGKYEPGQVHYEREFRTFGKDTVAFIYYKTCYL